MTVSDTPTHSPATPALGLPRLVCLHGGGTSAKIFRSQCRRLVTELQHEFRFVFAEAPFASQAGPDVMSVYHAWGPFKRWLRWREDQAFYEHEHVVAAIDASINTAVADDDALGATGPVVALLGFSQGAKVAASLLYRQQVRSNVLGPQFAGSQYRFAILIAGRAPLVDLNPIAVLPDIPNASMITDIKGWEPKVMLNHGHVLTQPTVHVHGLRDKGIQLHRQLLEEYCEEGSAIRVEWDGDHRVPLKRADVEAVADAIRSTDKLERVPRHRVT